MSIHGACIRTMQAILKSDIIELSQGQRLDRETGIFILDNDKGIGVSALRAIAEELDYRLEIFEADRTNLNDLEVKTSPLSEAARFGYQSEFPYIFVLRGWSPLMKDDPRINTYRRIFGRSGIVAIVSPIPAEAPAGFVPCDLSKLN